MVVSPDRIIPNCHYVRTPVKCIISRIYIVLSWRLGLDIFLCHSLLKPLFSSLWEVSNIFYNNRMVISTADYVMPILRTCDHRTCIIMSFLLLTLPRLVWTKIWLSHSSQCYSFIGCGLDVQIVLSVPCIWSNPLLSSTFQSCTVEMFIESVSRYYILWCVQNYKIR